MCSGVCLAAVNVWEGTTLSFGLVLFSPLSTDQVLPPARGVSRSHDFAGDPAGVGAAAAEWGRRDGDGFGRAHHSAHVHLQGTGGCWCAFFLHASWKLRKSPAIRPVFIAA